MDAAPRISIQEVLAHIRSATDRTRPFRLVVVRSTGRSRGDIRIMAQCIKGAPAGAPLSRGVGTQGVAGEFQERESAEGARLLHKEQDTIPITDLEDGQYKTILISHIIGFNEYKVYH